MEVECPLPPHRELMLRKRFTAEFLIPDSSGGKKQAMPAVGNGPFK